VVEGIGEFFKRRCIQLINSSFLYGRGSLDSIIKIESPNFNERDLIQAHEAMKAEWQEWERSDEGQKMAELFNKIKPRRP
jgi:hypothetical protein